MKFSHLNRRLHLYLSLSLFPWFVVYGVSSVVFSHSDYFNARDRALNQPLWTRVWERPCDIPVPDGDLRPLGARLMKDAGLDKAFGVYRPNPEQINVYIYDFWQQHHVIYYPARKTLALENKRFRFDHFLTSLHARGGFEQDGWLQTAWGIVVDIVCVAFLVWVASGLIMWWQLAGHRMWGWLALAAGCGTFVLFLARL
jgi:hypothetical protein